MCCGYSSCVIPWVRSALGLIPATKGRDADAIDFGGWHTLGFIWWLPLINNSVIISHQYSSATSGRVYHQSTVISWPSLFTSQLWRDIITSRSCNDHDSPATAWGNVRSSNTSYCQPMFGLSYSCRYRNTVKNKWDDEMQCSLSKSHVTPSHAGSCDYWWFCFVEQSWTDKHVDDLGLIRHRIPYFLKWATFLNRIASIRRVRRSPKQTCLSLAKSLMLLPNRKLIQGNWREPIVNCVQLR